MIAPGDNAAYNEQTMLLATGLNNVAVAFIVIGVVTPITAVSFGVPNAPPLNFGSAAFALLWFGAGTGLHWVGRNVLRSIRPLIPAKSSSLS